MLRNRRTIIDDDSDDDTYTNAMTREEIYQDQDDVFSKRKITEEYIKNIYNGLLFCFEYTYKGIKIIIKVSGIYLVWICLHYFASHLYIKLCVPSTIIGFLMSPFMTATPHCQGLRWVVYNAANMINNMWVILGAWICSAFLIINKDSMSSPSPSPVTMHSS
jgi:hypothetical protein